MSFSATITLGIVGTSITSVKVLSCGTDSGCSGGDQIIGYENVPVSSFPLQIYNIPNNTQYLKIVSLGECTASQCVGIGLIPTLTPTPTLTVTPTTTTSVTPTPTITQTNTPPALTATATPPALTQTNTPPVLTQTNTPPVLTQTNTPPVLTQTNTPPLLTLTPTIPPPTPTASEPMPPSYLFYSSAVTTGSGYSGVLNDSVLYNSGTGLFTFRYNSTIESFETYLTRRINTIASGQVTGDRIRKYTHHVCTDKNSVTYNITYTAAVGQTTDSLTNISALFAHPTSMGTITEIIDLNANLPSTPVPAGGKISNAIGTFQIGGVNYILYRFLSNNSNGSTTNVKVTTC